jgi:crotonobetainyl-CoA:carnitine CoA-transferase CaiB-like acyl-CoA transferase
LCAALGLERWTDHQTDDAVQDDIRRDLRAAFLSKGRDEWTAKLSPADTCVAPVLSVAEVVDDPQFAARGAFVEAKHDTHGAFRQVGPLFAGMRAAPSEPYAVRDVAETDTEELLRATGMSADECALLLETGVIA